MVDSAPSLEATQAWLAACPFAACILAQDGVVSACNDAFRAATPTGAPEGAPFRSLFDETPDALPSDGPITVVNREPFTQAFYGGVSAHPAGSLVVLHEATKLHCQAEHLRDLFQGAPDAIVVVGRDGRVVESNRMATKLLGRDHDGLRGMSVDAFVPTPHRGAHEKHREDYARAPQPRAMGAAQDLVAQDADGRVFPVEISLSPIGHPSEGYVAAALRDVTDRRRDAQRLRALNERLSQANEDLEAFAGRAAHDLKAPLTTIGLALGLLEESSGVDERVRMVMHDAANSAKLLAEMVDGLLDLAHVSQQEPPSEAVDLALVLEEARSMVQGELDEAHAAFETADLPTVPGDPRLLRTVFQNLLSNAARFRRPGTTPSVEVCVRGEGNAVVVEVVDNGRGIPEDRREAVFEPFVRAHHDVPGSGIGLPVCRRIVSLHGGTIEADARQDGPGTVMRVRLPLG